MDTRGFRELVDAHLDDRRDPLDDPRVTGFLVDHPELLEEFATLRGHLRALAGARSGSAGRRRRVAGTAVVPALVAGAVIAVTWWFAAGDAEPDIVLPDLSTRGQVLTYKSRGFTTGAGGQLSIEVETGELSTLERAVLTRIDLRATTPHGHPIRTRITRQRSSVRPEKIAE